MSIQDEIDRIGQNVANTYAALGEMGATMPATQNSDNLSDTVRTVPQSGSAVTEIFYVSFKIGASGFELDGVTYDDIMAAWQAGKRIMGKVYIPEQAALGFAGNFELDMTYLTTDASFVLGFISGSTSVEVFVKTDDTLVVKITQLEEANANSCISTITATLAFGTENTLELTELSNTFSEIQSMILANQTVILDLDVSILTSEGTHVAITMSGFVENEVISFQELFILFDNVPNMLFINLYSDRNSISTREIKEDRTLIVEATLTLDQSTGQSSIEIDETFENISNAAKEGKKVILKTDANALQTDLITFTDMTYYVEDFVIVFDTLVMFQEQITHFIIQLYTDGTTELSISPLSEDSNSDILKVTGQSIGSSTNSEIPLSLSHTYDQIKAAASSGKMVFLDVSLVEGANFIFVLSVSSGTLCFSSLLSRLGLQFLQVTVDENNTATLSAVDICTSESVNSTISDGIQKAIKNIKPEDIGALATTQLNSAINTALTQAKNSGEFNGPQGPQGPQGPKGDQGEQGPKGEDGTKNTYLFEAIVTLVDNSLIISLPDGVTYDVINQAITNKQHVVCIINFPQDMEIGGTCLIPFTKNLSGGALGFSTTIENTLLYLQINTDNSCTYGKYLIERQENRTDTINQNSTNESFPTTKAVYEFVIGQMGGLTFVTSHSVPTINDPSIITFVIEE